MPLKVTHGLLLLFPSALLRGRRGGSFTPRGSYEGMSSRRMCILGRVNTPGSMENKGRRAGRLASGKAVLVFCLLEPLEFPEPGIEDKKKPPPLYLKADLRYKIRISFIPLYVGLPLPASPPRRRRPQRAALLATCALRTQGRAYGGPDAPPNRHI